MIKNRDSFEDFFCLIALSSNKRALSVNAEKPRSLASDVDISMASED